MCVFKVMEMTTVLLFEVMSDDFVAVEICTSKN
jgi:hypothetical protein